MKYILILILFTGATARALAPAVNGAALIDGPAVFESDFNLKRSDVITSVKPSGRRSANQDHESIRNATLRAAGQTARAWQFGAEVQLADRLKDEADSTALSELNFNSGYRVGSVSTYAQLTVPVSRSAYEMEDQYQLNAVGRGFWAVGLGQYWGVSDGGAKGYVTYELHRSFDRTFANSENRGRLSPGYGFNWSVGGSYARGPVTGGVSVSGTYEDPVSVLGDRERKGGSAQRFVTPGVFVGFDVAPGWTVGAAYADQTIFPAATADLVREVGVTVTKSWR